MELLGLKRINTEIGFISVGDNSYGLHIFIVEQRDFRDSKESDTGIKNIFEEVVVVQPHK